MNNNRNRTRFNISNAITTISTTTESDMIEMVIDRPTTGHK